MKTKALAQQKATTADYHLGAHIAKSLRQRNIQIVFTVRKELSHTHELLPWQLLPKVQHLHCAQERETGCPHLNLTLVFQAGVLATVLPTPASSEPSNYQQQRTGVPNEEISTRECYELLMLGVALWLLWKLLTSIHKSLPVIRKSSSRDVGRSSAVREDAILDTDMQPRLSVLQYSGKHL
ncbi:hypothetical protein NQZ68_013607 [Dissostichus eleginoides]|nr:hypothetical protein NQZ68_013607 [Dissostichus eleginoides]